MSWAVANGLCIARKSVADVVRSFCEREDYAMGDVYDSGGRRLDEWRVLRHRVNRIVRGRDNAKWRTCPECKTTHYHALGPRYLVGCEPNSGWFANSGSGLLVGRVVHEALVMEFGEANVKRIADGVGWRATAIDGVQDLSDSRCNW